MEWQRHDAGISDVERDQGVVDLIALVGAVDGLLQAQARADADYFMRYSRKLAASEEQALRQGLLRAYRWQYIVSGVQNERFMAILTGMLVPAQMQRIGIALEPILRDAGAS